jgi:hypothetical protein
MNSAVFWQPDGTYCLNMAISEIPWNPPTLVLFFSHKILGIWVALNFFGCQVTKICHPKSNKMLHTGVAEMDPKTHWLCELPTGDQSS